MDIVGCPRDARFAPNSGHRSSLFDHFVREQRGRPSVFAVLRLITSAYDKKIVAAACYSLATNSEIVSEQKPTKVITALTACDTSHCQRSCSQLAGISVQLFIA